MAAVSEKVLQMVQEELVSNPEATNQELYDKAVEIDKSIKKLSLRQFHARYPLQVKRQMAATAREETTETGASAEGTVESRVTRRRGRRRKVEPDRGLIRATLIEFAKAVASAESKGDVVDVIGNVDEYVDKVLVAAQ